MSHQAKHIIIGVGPAGLAMAGRLAHARESFVVLEQQDSLSPSWRQHYDRVHLHTVKAYSALPHFPFSKEFPRYIPRQQLVEYYESYAEKFGIKPHFGKEVTSIKKDNGWQVSCTDGSNYEGENVIVCTGFNRKPNEPTWEGMEQFRGEILHSRFYKNGSKWKGKSVLVVGMGNTGAELSIDLYEHGATPYLSVRGPVNIVLRDLFGRPTQVTAMKLKKLPVWMSDWIGKQVSRLSVGNLKLYGLDRPDMAPLAQLRKFGKTPVIDVGTVDLIKSGKVKVYPGIDAFLEKGVRFTDGRELEVDAVVLATGYHCAVEEFLDKTEGIFNEHQVPRSLWLDQYPGLYFLGFDAYASGLLWAIYQDSEKILKHLLAGKKVKEASSETA
ncbi:MAG: NAD(P)/FAD-dependent oxidoreductase [Bacteroidota bacterium]